MIYTTKEKAMVAGSRYLSGLPDGFKVIASPCDGGHFEWSIEHGPVSIQASNVDDGFRCRLSIISSECLGIVKDADVYGHGGSPMQSVLFACSAAVSVINKWKSPIENLESIMSQMGKFAMKQREVECKSKSRRVTTKSRSVKRKSNSRSRI